MEVTSISSVFQFTLHFKVCSFLTAFWFLSVVFAGNHVKLTSLKCYVLNPELFQLKKCFVKAISRDIGTFNLIADLTRPVYAPINVLQLNMYYLGGSSQVCFSFNLFCFIAMARFFAKPSKHPASNGAALFEKSRGMCSPNSSMICSLNRLLKCLSAAPFP